VEFKTLIDVDSLRKVLAMPGLAVIDCRFDLANPDAGARAYLAGHIPGARYADLNRDLSAPRSESSGRHPLPAADRFAKRLEELGVGNDTQVVAYDESNGSFAARLWWLLRWLGHTRVAVLDGGIKAWIAAGGALEAGEASPTTAQSSPHAQPTPAAPISPPAASSPAPHFAPRPDATAAVTAAEVAAALRDPATLLVDARAAERYAGKVEPIDPVAGHIPGAVNHPFSTNLAADGRFLPAAELQASWRERLAGRDPRRVIAMCGSGVTACHNLLSLEIAGLSGAKLYAGSWSEWIRDPARPVARD
jgi:thiosulfate/3-mercaptopyruvate sulfurtransferase